jgi:hypothetical protein
MDIVTLDNDSTAATYSQISELGGREYLFRFHWNERCSLWFVDLYDQDESPIALGFAVVVGIPLFRGVIDARMPPGVMGAVDLSDNNTDPGRDELGKRVVIAYWDGQP